MVERGTDELELSDEAKAELRILRVAAAAIDLQRLVGPEMAQQPAVRAMIEAGWAVFLELGRGGAGGDDFY
ncbi:MAG: hypothetical protein K2X71_15355 [Methylobacterium sp.]|uniref:hypothetical protein n=1 Tax=Methylobacterium sp. TaxID=409 RepID=UPI00258B2521|nr:hypothetical protein [Methylobacterium sp.]MBY0297392.1 hypothetical protein [Methylobacterium sp.]